MLELHIGNVLTKVVGDIPPHVLIAIREECAYSIKGAEFSTYGANTYCPFCKKMTEALTWEEKCSVPQDGFSYRKCRIHGLVRPISLWDGRKFLFDSRSEKFPTGIISRVIICLRKNHIPYKIIDERIVPYTRRLTWDGPQLRYYQKEAVDMLIKKSRGIIQASMGTGKTVCLAAMVAEVGVNTVILSHTVAVFNQIYETLKKCLKMPIGRIGDGHKDIKKITVVLPQAIVGSVKVPKRKLVSGRWKDVMSSVQVIKDEYKDLMLNTEALFIDECFPGNTKVHTDRGEVSIHDIVMNRLPYRVVSFNGTSFEYKPIARYIRNPSPKTLLQIYLANREYTRATVTPNHKMAVCNVNTRNITYKRADELKAGDFIVEKARVRCLSGNVAPLPTRQQDSILLGSALGNGTVSRVMDCYKLRLHQGETLYDYFTWKNSLLSNLLIPGYHIDTSEREINNWVDTQLLPTTEPLFDLDNPKRLKRALKKLDALALAVWFMDCGTRQAGGAKFDTAKFSYECVCVLRDALNEKFHIKAKVVENRVINKHILKVTPAQARILYKTIQNYVPSCVRHLLPEENRKKYNMVLERFNEFGVSEVTKTEEVQSKEDYVYNIEVQDNHNYLVNAGILVSNCHRAAADTVQLVANSCVNAYFRVGVTATPYRADLLDILIESVTGKVNYKYTATRAIEDGYLSRPRVHMVGFKQSPYPRKKEVDGKLVPVKYIDLYADRVVRNVVRNRVIANLAAQHFDKHESVLVIVRYLEHGQLLYDMLKHLGPTVRYVNGENDSEELKQVLKDLNTGECRICIASGIFNEGIDVTGLNVCINTTACDSPVTAMQILGRTLRKTTTKSVVDFYDIADYGVRWLGEHAANRLEMYRTEPAFEIIQEDSSNYLDS